jgi:ribosomal protein S18
MNVVSKILSRRVTKLPMKLQKKVATEISRARFLALLSYGA